MAPDRRQGIRDQELSRVREMMQQHDGDAADTPPDRRAEDVDRVREQLREHDEDAGES